MWGMTKPKPKFGGMFPGGMESPYTTPPIVAPQRMAEEGAAAPAPEPRKPGFFKPGGAGQYVFAALADTLARQMDEAPTAVAGIMQQQQRAQELAEKQRMASVERENGWQDWLRKKEWEQANPGPVNNDTVADYNFIRQTLGDEAGQAFLRNKADPPQYRQGPDGQFYRVSPPVSAPVGKLTPIDGGPSQSATATFPRR